MDISHRGVWGTSQYIKKNNDNHNVTLHESKEYDKVSILTLRAYRGRQVSSLQVLTRLIIVHTFRGNGLGPSGATHQPHYARTMR